METPTSPRWAYRIRLSYRGRVVKLQSAIRLEMIAPPSIHTAGADQEAGAWFTLKDSEGRALYRRPMGNPFGGMRCALGAEREFAPISYTSSEGTIEILIPELPAADSLTLYASETEGPKAYGRAQSVTTLSLAKIAALAKRKG